MKRYPFKIILVHIPPDFFLTIYKFQVLFNNYSQYNCGLNYSHECWYHHITLHDKMSSLADIRSLKILSLSKATHIYHLFSVLLKSLIEFLNRWCMLLLSNSPAAFTPGRPRVSCSPSATPTTALY